MIAQLRWIQDTLAPRLTVFPIVAEALEMGDECHSRNRAVLPLLIQKLMPALL